MATSLFGNQLQLVQTSLFKIWKTRQLATGLVTIWGNWQLIHNWTLKHYPHSLSTSYCSTLLSHSLSDHLLRPSCLESTASRYAVVAIAMLPNGCCGITKPKKNSSWHSFNLLHLHLPSSVALLILRWAKSLSASDLASSSSLIPTIIPSTLTPVQMQALLPKIICNFPLPNCVHPHSSSICPCHFSIHHEHQIHFNRQGMNMVKHLVTSLTTFFYLRLGHIELLIKVMMRVLKMLSKGMQLELLTPLIMKLMDSGMERMFPWNVM